MCRWRLLCLQPPLTVSPSPSCRWAPVCRRRSTFSAFTVCLSAVFQMHQELMKSPNPNVFHRTLVLSSARVYTVNCPIFLPCGCLCNCLTSSLLRVPFVWQSLVCLWTHTDEEAALKRSSGAACLCLLVTLAVFSAWLKVFTVCHY